MKKELIITIFIIAIVIIGNIITQNYTKKCIEAMNDNLIELKQEIKKQDKESQVINFQIENIKDEWDNMQEKLAFYVEHDELEKVEAQLFMIKGNIEVKRYDESLPELEKCIFILEHIEDKCALDIKNLF